MKKVMKSSLKMNSIKWFLILLVNLFVTNFNIIKAQNSSEQTQQEVASSSSSTYKVVSETQFLKDYKNIQWMHIGRLLKLNETIDLKKVNKTFNFSTLKFNHDLSKRYAYLLFNKEYLIVSPKK